MTSAIDSNDNDLDESSGSFPVSPSTVSNDSVPEIKSGKMKRCILAFFGIVFVGIAGAGVFLPGIPTVGPLLLASLLFTKSFPALEKRLIRNRFFAKFLPYLDGSTEMPLKAKLASIGMMWASIAISCIVLFISGKAPNWLFGVLVIAGMVGTIFILRFGRPRS